MDEDKKRLKQQYSASNVLDRLRLKQPSKELVPVGSAAFFLGGNWPIREVYESYVIIQYGNSKVRIEMSELCRSRFKDERNPEKENFDEEQISRQVRGFGKNKSGDS